MRHTHSDRHSKIDIFAAKKNAAFFSTEKLELENPTY